MGDQLKKIYDYYSKPFVQYELIKFLQRRYLSGRKMVPTEKNPIVFRYLSAYTVQLLQQCFNRLDVASHPVKLYFDLTVWRQEGISGMQNAPFFSFKPEERAEQKKSFTDEEEWKKYAIGFDFALDFDSSPYVAAYEEASKIKEVFDKKKLPYTVGFSGERGMHLRIPTDFFPDSLPVLERPVFFKKIAEQLSCEYDFRTIDFSVYNYLQILKLPYSLNLCGNGTTNVVLPLDDEQFKNFSLELVELDSVLRNVKIYKRGALLRTHGLTGMELKENVASFLRSF